MGTNCLEVRDTNVNTSYGVASPTHAAQNNFSRDVAK